MLPTIESLEKKLAQIKVVDTGKGISEEFLPFIFNPFSQADSSSTRIYGGMGLGLSIVRNLVELQAGTVIAENRFKNGQVQGALFTINFPVRPFQEAIIQSIVPCEDAGLKRTFKLDEEEIPRLDGIRILFVDDDESTRDAICIYLKAFGADVKAVDSASEVLRLLPDFRPNILISDIAMPGEDGNMMMRKIRNFAANLGGNVPALALSAYGSDEDNARIMAAGFHAHLQKPIEANELARLIKKYAQ